MRLGLCYSSRYRNWGIECCLRNLKNKYIAFGTCVLNFDELVLCLFKLMKSSSFRIVLKHSGVVSLRQVQTSGCPLVTLQIPL